MTGMRHLTDPNEFKKFHYLLTREHPGYMPWYFLLSKGLKDPVAGIKWKQLEGRLTFEQAIKAMQSGHNVGIVASGMDQLCIVDIDDIETTPDEIMKPTLSIRSRKRIGRHYFYMTQDPRCKENLPTDDKGEIRACWEYVVAPGSFVMCNAKTIAEMPESQRALAGRYTVENERCPNIILFEELPPVFLEQAEKNKTAEIDARKKREAKAKARKNTPAQYSDKNRSAMWDLSINDVINIPSKARFGSLFHESETGKNTAVNDDGGLTCWRHLVSQTPLSALAVLAGVTDCLDAGQGFNGGKPSGIDYADGRTLFTMWAFAKHEGMIPTDDPIPSEAIRWYACHKCVCKPSDMIDGWKLPSDVYSRTLKMIEDTEKVSTGRNIVPTNDCQVSTYDNGPTLYKVVDMSRFAFIVTYAGDTIEKVGDDIYRITDKKLVDNALTDGIIESCVGAPQRQLAIFSPDHVSELVVSIEKYRTGNTMCYEITTKRGTFEIQQDDVRNLSVWKRLLFSECKIDFHCDLRSTGMGVQFSKLYCRIDDESVLVHHDELSDDEMNAGTIMEKLRMTARITDNIDEFDVGDVYRKIEKNGDVFFYYRVSSLKILVESLKFEFSWKTKKILKEYISGDSKQISVAGKQVRVWKFVPWDGTEK